MSEHDETAAFKRNSWHNEPGPDSPFESPFMVDSSAESKKWETSEAIDGTPFVHEKLEASRVIYRSESQERQEGGAAELEEAYEAKQQADYKSEMRELDQAEHENVGSEWEDHLLNAAIDRTEEATRLRGSDAVDPYDKIRMALSVQYENLPSDEITRTLGTAPAALALYQMLESPIPRQAALAVLLGKGGRSLIRVNGENIPVGAYLRSISQLCVDAATPVNGNGIASGPTLRPEKVIPQTSPELMAETADGSSSDTYDGCTWSVESDPGSYDRRQGRRPHPDPSGNTTGYTLIENRREVIENGRKALQLLQISLTNFHVDGTFLKKRTPARISGFSKRTA